ncbi:MAG: hypothetical protein HC802_12175 [Caldilineaceae bacterium]|nr:hypothetical protein [Caldilineaceae bacterium]
MSILANSRPYEGLIAGLIVGFALVIGFARPSQRLTLNVASRLIVPAILVLAINFLWMATYNHRVTGSVWKLPYQAWTQQEGGDFLLTHKLIGSLYRTKQYTEPPRLSDQWFDLQDSRSVARKILRQWGFYVTPSLLPALFFLALAVSNRKIQFFLAGFAVVLTACLIQGTGCHTHYLAPVTPLVFGVFVGGFRRLRRWRWQGRPSGRMLVFTLPISWNTLWARSRASTVRRHESFVHTARPRASVSTDRGSLAWRPSSISSSLTCCRSSKLSR